MKKMLLVAMLVLALAVPAFADSLSITKGSIQGSGAAAGTISASGAAVIGTGYASAGGGAFALGINGCRTDIAVSKSGGGVEVMSLHGIALAGTLNAGGAAAGGFKAEWCSVDFGKPYNVD